MFIDAPQKRKNQSRLQLPKYTAIGKNETNLKILEIGTHHAAQLISVKFARPKSLLDFDSLISMDDT